MIKRLQINVQLAFCGESVIEIMTLLLAHCHQCIDWIFHRTFRWLRCAILLTEWQQQPKGAFYAYVIMIIFYPAELNLSDTSYVFFLRTL